MAMEYAGLSRPASALNTIYRTFGICVVCLGTSTDFHGIQCGIATLIAAKVYEQVKDTVPNVKGRWSM